MPRKQRFKPSRKPQQVNQGVVSNEEIGTRNEAQGDAQDIEKAAPERITASEVEGGQL